MTGKEIVENAIEESKYIGGEMVDGKKAIEIFERDKKDSLLMFVKMQSNDWWELNE